MNIKLEFTKWTKTLSVIIICVALGLSVSNGQTSIKSDQTLRAVKQSELQRVNPNKTDEKLKWKNNFRELSAEQTIESFNKYWQNAPRGKGDGWKPFKRQEHFWKSRLGEKDQMPNIKMLFKQWQARKENKKAKPNQDAKWEFVGPTNQPKSSNNEQPTGLGRMNCVRFDPNNPDIIWAGAAFGGVWRSSDGGESWQTFPFTQFLSIGISDIAIAQSSSVPSKTIYAATGDADGSFGGISCYSVGVIKTTDWGETWSLAGLANEIDDRTLINRLLADPRDPDRVYAATTNGLFLTEDGGSTWDTLSPIYCRDLEFKPGSPDKLWGAFIFNADGQTRYGILSAEIFQKEGKDSLMLYRTPVEFPYGEVIRISVNVNSNYPEYVYALSCNRYSGLHSVIYTNNGGQDWYYLVQTLDEQIGGYYWDLLNAEANPDSIDSRSQGHYDLCIAASPDSPLDVYIGGVNVWRHVGDLNWALNAYWTTQYEDEGADWVHADHHDLAFSPDGYLYSAHDGGISKFDDNEGEWTDLSSGLQVTQFYRINASKTDPDIIIGGCQDNGTFIKKNKIWYYATGGDGMDCQIDPLDNSFMYASTYYGKFYKSTDGGDRFFHLMDTTTTRESADWTAPFVLDPIRPDILYAGYENVWRNIGRGSSPWEKISNFSDDSKIRHISVSKADNDYIYVIKPADVFQTTDGGENWNSLISADGEMLLSSIAIDKDDPTHFWITRSGYIEDQKVFEYKEGNLYNYSDGIPNVPVNCIAINKTSQKNQLFVGTDIGVFYRDSEMNQWEKYGTGMPSVVIQDLDISYNSGELRAGTFARGIWEVKIIDCSIPPPEIEMSKGPKICEGDTLVLTVKGDYAEYNWSTGETTKSIEVTEEGIYNVTVKDENNCVAISEDISVSVVAPPEIRVSPALGKSGFCKGDSLRLNASPSLFFETFEWYYQRDSLVGSEKSHYAKSSGSYSVIGFTKEECESVSEVKIIEEYKLPEKPEITVEQNTLTSSEAYEYQWYFEDEEIDGANERNYEAEETGYYKVLVTNENGCSNMSDAKYVEVVGVEDDYEKSRVSIKPNPITNVFNLKISLLKASEIKIEINDMVGKTIAKYNPQGKRNEFEKLIDLEDFPAGVYFVKIITADKTYVKKIIKE